MNADFAPWTAVILAVTGVVSVVAFGRRDIHERFLFSPHAVLVGKEYHRLVTSGFLHADWIHLLFNAFSFYSFAGPIERFYGSTAVLVIHFSGIVGGNLLSLWLHRFHDYRALGASGGVCGIIFAHIFLLPGGGVYIVPVPIAIPTWLYAILFLVGSYAAMRRQRDNIGHDAHIGGALVGLLAATLMFPRIVMVSPVLYCAVIGISVALFLHLTGGLSFRGLTRWFQREPQEDRHPRYSTAHLNEPREVDRILEKIARGGVQSLTPEEHRLLEKHARRLRRRE